MTLFAQYRIEEKTSRIEYQKTRATGLVPITFAFMLMLSRRGPIGPGLWCALGFACGLVLTVWGSYRLHFVEGPVSRFGRALTSRSDTWFPPFMFLARQTLTLLTLFMIWITLVELGFPATLLLHLLVFAILVLVPAKAFTHELAITTAEHEALDIVLHYVIAILITLFFALSITRFVAPPDQPPSPEPQFGLLFVWVPALLIMGTYALLLIAHLRPTGRRKPSSDEPDRPRF